MRGQNYCLPASPVTRRRWGLRLCNAYSCQGKGASNSIRSFVALLQASLLKTSPVSRLKTIRKDECFSSVLGTGSPEESGRYTPSKSRVKTHPILHSTLPNIPVENQPGFLSENYKKRRVFSSVSTGDPEESVAKGSRQLGSLQESAKWKRNTYLER